MKAGDLIKFAKWHYSRPGYEYCADWIGLVCENLGEYVKVYWVTPGHGSTRGCVVLSEYRSYEIINDIT